MKVLVIGGCGFIGSHIVDALVARGHSVSVFDRAVDSCRTASEQVAFYQGNFEDEQAVGDALEDCDLVMHLLSTTVPGTSNQDPVSDIRGNLINTVRLLDLMREKDVGRLVFLSSGGTVYGILGTELVNEDHPLRPISSYGIVKAAIENYLHMEHYLYGMEYTVLRASNPYGPRQVGAGIQGVIGTYLAQHARGETLELWGDGEIVRDFIFIDDLVDLCVKAAEKQVSGIFNAGSGEGHSIREVINQISEVVGDEIKPVCKPGRKLDVPRLVLDISKAQNTFDWSPDTSLRNGIEAHWKWLQDQSR